MSSEPSKQALEQNIASHIFNASSTMVGMSLTCLGLFRISDRIRNVSTLINELVAINTVAFLASCVLSYFCLRRSGRPGYGRLEKLAEWLFLFGIAVMALLCGLVAYEFL